MHDFAWMHFHFSIWFIGWFLELPRTSVNLKEPIQSIGFQRIFPLTHTHTHQFCISFSRNFSVLFMLHTKPLDHGCFHTQFKGMLSKKRPFKIQTNQMAKESKDGSRKGRKKCMQTFKRIIAPKRLCAFIEWSSIVYGVQCAKSRFTLDSKQKCSQILDSKVYSNFHFNGKCDTHKRRLAPRSHSTSRSNSMRT